MVSQYQVEDSGQRVLEWLGVCLDVSAAQSRILHTTLDS